MRIDFYTESVSFTKFDGDISSHMMVSPMDIAHALASELHYSTGLLPENALFWVNTNDGAVTAIYQAPRIRRVALQEKIGEPARRFTLPMPGLIFLCMAGNAPWLYAVKHRPTKEDDPIYKAPLANVFDTGKTCAGSQKYTNNPLETVELFFTSFFTRGADLGNRSQKFPENVIHLWEFIDKKPEFPLDDLVRHGLVKDLMQQEVN